MDISILALEAMGFKSLGPGESLSGTFTRVDVFSIQGIYLESDSKVFH